MERDFAASKMSLLAKERLAESDISIVSSLCAKHPSISFSAGEPDAAFYPTAELKEAFSLALDDPSILNYYPSDMGYAPLRKWLAEWMVSEGTAPSSLSDKNILLTHGAAEAINSVTEMFLEPGAIVAVEEASYVEALMNFRKQGAFCLGVPMDEDGIIPEKFEALCDSNHITMFYTVPCFQNPTGRTTSLARRKAVLDICARNEIMILEDDPYGALSYDGETPPSIRSLAPERTVYMGSFSKVLAPGLRLGYVIAPPALRAKLVQAKQATDLHTATLSQMAVYDVVKDGFLDTHIPTIRKLYREQCTAMLAALTHYMPEGVRWNTPRGGMFLWAELPKGIDATAVLARAVEQNVAFVPGAPFYAANPVIEALRLAFVTVPPPRIEEGVERLAKVIRASL